MRLAETLKHPVIREWLAISLALCLLAYVTLQNQWLWRLDQSLYDQAIGLVHRPPQDDIIIVGIDEESLKQLGRWPWQRGIHATLLNKLTEAKPKVVVLDVILTEPDKVNPAGDLALAAAVKTNGKVILPLTMDVYEGTPVGEVKPLPKLAEGAAKLSHISLNLDPDGVLRSIYLRSGMGAARHDVSPIAALKVADPLRWNESLPLPGEANTNKTVISRLWVRDNYFHIPYAGPPGHFKTVPYIEILRGDFPVEAMKDKIVLVGATAASLTDAYPTPVSGGERAMAGIEVQANIIQALRENIDIRLVSASKLIFFACLTTLSLMLAYLWLTPRLSLLLTVVAIFLCLIGAALLFRYQYIWMSPTVPIMTLLLAYPLWSWRKLEATQRYFDTELTRLESERSIVPQETAQSIAPQAAAKLFMPDVVEKRIAAVQSAAQRMRNLNRFVADSLESLPQAALVTNADGRVMIANSSADALFKSRRQRTGDRPADPTLEGRDVFALMAAFQHEDGRSWREIWVDAYEETHLVSLEAKGPEGHEFLVQIAPSFSARGKQTGSILTLVDISPLRESERRRDEALRFLSHDMRSPQASILTLLDMYSHDPQSMTTEKLVERVGKYSRRTLNLADDFLRLAKAERVKSQDFELLELGELLRDAVEEAWSVATTKKIAIKLDIPATEAWVAGDRDLLTRALLNLLSNATKYSPPETTITCALHGEAGKWILDITDQGYGIGESDMSRLFMRFTRLKHEGKPDEGGIGLGLVFVKTVIERHGGAINVRSRVATPENSASGTTFALTFPAKETPLD